MWPKKPILINDHLKIEKVHSKSQSFLDENIKLRSQIATHLWAYYQIGNLIPQTKKNLLSGHYFPYLESYYHLECSFELCLEGFYTYSLLALRSVLELGALQVFFAIDDSEYEEIRPWFTSKIETPRFRRIISNFKRIEKYDKFNNMFKIDQRILKKYSEISDIVHTRGYYHSSRVFSKANYNMFLETSLKKYCEFMFSVVSDLVIILLLKYPIGLQPIPLSQKFGLNGPMGGFLESHDVKLISSIIKPEEKKFLKELSDKDSEVMDIVNFFKELPNLTEEEWEKQINDFYDQHPNLHKDMSEEI